MPNRKKYYSLQSFFSYMRRHKVPFGFVFALFVIADAFLAVIPLFIGRLVGVLAAHPVDSHAAYLYVVLLIVASTGHDIVWRLSEYAYMRLLNPMGYRYETIIFSQIIQKPYPYFVDKFTGKIGSYISTLGEEFRTMMDNIFWNYIGLAVSLIGVIVVLLALDWQTGVIFLVGLLMMLITGRYTVHNSATSEKHSADVQSTKRGKIIDAISNFVNVKSFQKEADEIKTVEHEQAKTIHAARQSFWYSMVFWGSLSLVVREFIWPVTIILNVYLYLHHQISLSTLTTFLSSVLLFTNFIWEVIWYVSQFNLKLARIEEAHMYLFGPVNIVDQHYQMTARNQQKRHFESALTLQHLSFAYPDKSDTTVLHDINLTIKKGEKIGIVGKSGSGKTTLTKLLLGYYQTTEDEILLDGETIDTRDLAQLISYVPQDTSLFHRSVADNIAYATDRVVTREDVVRAAKQAHADEFITKISDGYEALVGERGVKLSAGQRQRIAIARAFLDDKPLLILDEATSALDSESEILVQEALEALWQDKTVIAIAHRLSTLRHMDSIIVMDTGKIVEHGSHEALLARKGIYAKLWNHQSGGFLEDNDES